MNTVKYCTLASHYDQLELSVMIVQPDKKIKGVVQLLHGMAEYKERYLPFMHALADQGYICVIHDHRGHGKSIRSKEDYGYFYDANGEYLIEDSYQITKMMKKMYQGYPYVLFSHSMGSLISRAYVKKYDYMLDGLIVCGSPSKQPGLSFAILFVKMMQWFYKDRHRSKLIQHLAFGSFEKKFPSKQENAWICSVEEEVEKYNQHEACGFIFTLNGFENLFKIMKKVYETDRWVLRNPSMPILFIAGKEDPCIINPSHFQKAINFMKKVGYQNVIAKLYEGKRHELLNEDNKMEIYQDVLKWIDEQVIHHERTR
ncbi:MAG: lysophospholipase [Erysipelotrichaceae bacterium]|nr:lysophospholipase [Erysipelotrichaceae bacterium]